MTPPTVPSFVPVSIYRFASPKMLMLVIVAIFLAATTGCVSQSEYKALETAHRQAMAQLAEAENDLNAARAKIADLEARLAALNGAGEGLDALKKERDLLAAQLADLQDKYNKLLALNSSNPVLPEDVNAALKDFAAKHPDLVEFDPNTGMVRFKSDLTFELGSTVVRPAAKEALAEFATILNYEDIKSNEIQCVGHTDDVPIRRTTTMQMNPTNQILSTNRAWAVADVLYANGVSEGRVTGAGWGEQRPIAPNAPGMKGNEKNRRVDVYIRPTKVPEGITISTPGAAAPVRATPRKAPGAGKAKPALKAPAAPTTQPVVPVPAG